MNTDTILNIMVATVATHTIANARFAHYERRMKVEQFGAKYTVTAALSAFTMLGLWIWLAVHTGYWQFAALVAIPLLITIGTIAAKPKTVGVSR